jgi:hypothetical protein
VREAQAGRQLIVVTEAKTDTLWYDTLAAHATHVLTVQGRVDFNGAAVREAARTESMTALAIVLFGFNVSLVPLADLGRVHSPRSGDLERAGTSWYGRPEPVVRIEVRIAARDDHPPAGFVYVDGVRSLQFSARGCTPPGFRVREADGRPNHDEVAMALARLDATYPQTAICAVAGCEPRRARRV